MDRREFLKKTAIAAASTAMAAPVSAMLGQASSGKPDVSEESPSTIKTEGKWKVLMINGSPRADGNTFCALQEIATQLEKHGVGSEIIQIGRAPVRSCINCGACHQAGECVFDDDLCNTVAQKMSESDALLMQRVFYSAGRYVQDKPAAAVAICRRGGATTAFQTMNMMFQMMNMPVVTSQYWNIAYGMGKGQARLDSEGMQTMRTLASNMAFDSEGMQTMRTLASNMAWLLEKIHAGGSASPDREKQKQFMNFIR